VSLLIDEEGNYLCEVHLGSGSISNSHERKGKKQKKTKTNYHKDMLENDSAARAAAGDMHVL
jgi:hypothetical protein